jgi:glycosyltransferase involved in cell wall biosynthesis
MANIKIVSLPTYEPWDFSNPDVKGIGGSETSHIEMARRLARAGHTVTSFAPIASDEPVMYEGVEWRTSTHIEFADPADVWIIYREPELIEFIPEGRNVWLVCQDTNYPSLTKERGARYSRIVALCEDHATHLKHFHTGGNVCVSANGIKAGLIKNIAADPPARNPRRLMYASSPDRGMEYLLQIFPRVRELISDAELHVFYGFDNIEKTVRRVGPDHPIAVNMERIKALLDQPGVTWHGRIGQPELLHEWFKSGIWCHPSNFTETSCITSMDAQACGAIPVTRPIWAIRENVRHGIFMEGDVRNDLVRARYVQQIYSLMVQPELQQRIRSEMMPWAQHHFDWERVVSQWDGWISEDLREKAAA